MRYSIEDLCYLMARLRDPKTGCPWDLKQTSKSVVPHTLEEIYELVDAIESDDVTQTLEELGDVLFQVIFYSQLASEQAQFNFDDVAHNIVAKLLRRHPHVFPDGILSSERSNEAPSEALIKANWEQAKTSERAEKSMSSLLDDVPRALPAIVRAEKLQKRARLLGFDWNNVGAVVEALKGEIEELEVAMAEGSAEEIADEIGDVLFSAVNLSRHVGVNAESATRAAAAKFERRFRYVEQRCIETGFSADDSKVDEQLDRFWNEAKAQGL